MYTTSLSKHPGSGLTIVSSLFCTFWPWPSIVAPQFPWPVSALNVWQKPSPKLGGCAWWAAQLICMSLKGMRPDSQFIASRLQVPFLGIVHHLLLLLWFPLFPEKGLLYEYIRHNICSVCDSFASNTTSFRRSFILTAVYGDTPCRWGVNT